MDYEMTAEQQEVRGAVGTLLARRAGADRARQLDEVSAADVELADALARGGFLDLLRDPDGGPLGAEIVTELVAAAAGRIPIGCRSLVAPAVTDVPLPNMVTVMEESTETTPVRFGAQAEAILVLDGPRGRLVTLGPGSARPVASMYGYPMARVSLEGAEVLANVDGDEARRWWQVALAAEIAGTIEAAFALTLAHHKSRFQFDRPIGSYQSLQHRMADLYVRQQAVAWLAREAAYHGAPAERAAAAATYAAEAAGSAGIELHQMSGAIGFTREYDLHIWTLRLQALRLELGGARRHSLHLARARWG
jgi:alkylation response protein AidB-like acyl-CoA dehydrogenase